MIHFENPQMELNDVTSTLEFIADQEYQGIDCTALREYISPILSAKRINLECLNVYNIDSH